MKKKNIRNGRWQPLLSKGFTLIELLAVIVILAIIALIAVPIVLNIINDSKKSTTIRSAENYLKAVELYITKENIDEEINPSVCTVQENGNLSCAGYANEIPIELDGEKPNPGTKIKFEKGKIVAVSDFKISNKNIKASELGLEEYIAKICKKVDSTQEDYAIGTKYECNVNENDKFYFYVLSEHEDTNKINLIMDRNICDDGTTEQTDDNSCTTPWINYDDFEKAGGSLDEWKNIAFNWPSNNTKGPVTVFKFLNEATKNWTEVPNLNEDYKDEGNHYGTIRLSGKARLIKYNEVSKFETIPPFLLENFSTYWFLSSYSENTVGVSNICYAGIYMLSYNFTAESLGARPVITLLKSNLYS